MSETRVTNAPSMGYKLQYQGPEVELHSLRTPLSLLTTMSESQLHLEGDVGNYEDGDEFY